MWLLPTGKAIYSLISVLIMGLFHSPLIAFTSLVIIIGIFATKRNEQILDFGQKVKKSLSEDAKIASFAYLQSEEEEVFGRMVKTSIKANVYRTLLIEELQRANKKLYDHEIKYFEFRLRARFFERNDYEKYSEELKELLKNREV